MYFIYHEEIHYNESMTEPNFTPLQVDKKQAFQALLELEEKERTMKSRQSYIKAYFWSVALPPIGIYYLIKYIFFSNGTNDDIKAGFISLTLTIVSFLFSMWLFGLFINQASNLMPPQTGDVLKELITPENQQKLRNL